MGLDLLRTILVSCVLLICTDAFSSPAVITLSQTDVIERFAQHVAYHVEPVEGLSASDAYQETLAASAYGGEVLNLGRQETPVWLRFTVDNRSDESSSWTLMTMRTSLAVLEIYEVVDGQPVILFDHGNEADRVANLREYYGLAAPFSVNAGESKEILIRFQAVASGWLPMLLVPEHLGTSVLLDRLTLAMFFAAAVLTLVGINLLYFIFTRRPIYAWYCLSTVFALLAAGHLRGATTVFWFAADPALGRVFGACVITVAAMFMSVFALGFFKPDKSLRSPFFLVYGAIIAAGSAYVAMMACAAVLEVNVDGYISIGWLVSALVYVVLPVHATYAVLKGNKAAWPLVVGWSLYLAFTVVTVFSTLGYMEPMSIHWLMLGPVIFVETSLMAVALALQVRAVEADRAVLRQEKEHALEELADTAKLVLAVGHDSRNMLAGIEHLSRDMTNASSPDQARLEAMKVQSLASTLNDTLSILINESRTGLLESGGEAIEMVSVSEAFKTINLLFERRLAEQNLTLDFRSQGDSIAADRAILIRSLANLVDNAIKYGTGDRILVTYRCRFEEHVFQVWNQGEGLQQNQMESLLADDNSLFRYQSNVSGEGVGLAICKELVAKAGGHLIGNSRPGHTTMFGFELPYPDVNALQDWTIRVSGHSASRSQIENTLGSMRQLAGRRGRNTLQLFIPENRAQVDSLASGSAQRTVIATFDRSREFRRRWQTPADSFLYLPAEPESLVCALNSAVRKAA